jgi:hypothetical protein
MRLFIKGFEQVVIGTTWEFGFSPDNKDLVQFVLDSGLVLRICIEWVSHRQYPVTIVLEYETKNGCG